MLRHSLSHYHPGETKYFMGIPSEKLGIELCLTFSAGEELGTCVLSRNYCLLNSQLFFV